MNNAEEMQERLPEMPPPLRKGGMNRCYQCNGPFGLVRHRLGFKTFCSKRCLDNYKTGTEREMSRIND